MSIDIAILGTAARVGDSVSADLEAELRQVVLTALEKAGTALEEIDAVVTVASDTLDGVMVPIRAEVAGAYGKAPLNVPSSAGHALAAAAVLLGSGQAERVLLAGWGAASKLAVHDSRDSQASPFDDRPVGAGPAQVAALQAQELRAAHPDLPEPDLTFASDAVALVLAAANGTDKPRIADLGTSSRGYYPEDDLTDPALWVTEALGKWSGLPESALLAVSGPSRTCEARALAPIGASGHATGISTGSEAWFGPATALHQAAQLADALSDGSGEGVLIDLAGPMGQHVSCFRFIGGRA